jgi:ATP-dependent Lhr-like helicase
MARRQRLQTLYLPGRGLATYYGWQERAGKCTYRYRQNVFCFFRFLIKYINDHPDSYQTKTKNGLQLIWVTPLRALAKDIGRAMEEVIGELGLSWKVGIRNGDTSAADRQKQKRQMPEVLIITPESMHLFLAQKDYALVFETLKVIAVDEWHELIGSKRGVQVELAISRIVGSLPLTPSKGGGTASAQALLAGDSVHMQSHRKVRLVRRPLPPWGGGGASIWGISATIGNLEEAMDVLLAPVPDKGVIVRAKLNKALEVQSILPDSIEKYPGPATWGLNWQKRFCRSLKKAALRSSLSIPGYE